MSPLAASRLTLAELPREPAGAQPFVLDRDALWVVRSGRVDVFYVDGRPGTRHGRRRHLFRVDAPGVVVGMRTAVADVEIGSFQATCTYGTKLRALSLSRFRELRQHGPAQPELARLLEGWTEALCRAIAGAVLPQECVDLSIGSRLDVSAGTTVRPGDGVAWIAGLPSDTRVFAEPSLPIGDVAILPLSPRGWVEIPQDSTIEVCDTLTIVERDDAWTGLACLHRLALVRAQHMLDADDLREGRRQQKKGEASRAKLFGAFRQIASGLETSGSVAAVPALPQNATTQESLFAACTLVGDALGITIAPQRVKETGPASRRVEAIARGSRCRTRRVRLEGRWWTQDLGALVAFTQEGDRPVALVPRGVGHYTLHDPQTGTAKPIDAGLAKDLSPNAISFYRSFPYAPIGIVEMLKFGARGCRQDLVAVALVGAAAGLLATAPPLAAAALYNSIIPGAERGQLVQLLLVLVACAIASAAFQITRTISLVRIDTRMGAAVQAAVWDRLLSLPAQFFRGYSAGDLAVRAMGVSTIQQALSGTTIRVALSGIFSVFSYALLFYYDPVLAGYATLLMLVALGATILVTWLQLKYQREVSQVRGKTSGLVLQFLTGISKLRVAGAEVVAFSKWAALFSRQRQAQYQARRIGIVYSVFNSALPMIASLVLFWVVSQRLTEAAGLRTGDFLGFMTAFNGCLAAALATGSAVVSILAVVPVYEMSKPILKTLPEVSDGKLDPGTLTGEIRIDHVVFRYQPAGPPILHDVSLHIRPGEFVAFVGPSGSGKSTLLRLLLLFETPESGSIHFDGQDVQDLDMQMVRRQIGVVLQGGRLTPGDMFTQIVGSSGASMKDAWDAAARAGLDEDIRQMPMGMHTVVSEGGGTLSGGQRQRLMIARALVTNPRIMFLDEATSALDNRTQALVTESLERLRATRLVVAHRLSTIIKADRIYVIEHGKVVQQGTYDELMGQPGPFAELARRQMA